MQMELLLVLQLMLALLMVIMLVKLTQLKKQITQIITEVKAYITFITEDMDNETEEAAFGDLNKGDNKAVQQSQLIHAVLQEYFP